jgi:hypothetical protein
MDNIGKIQAVRGSPVKEPRCSWSSPGLPHKDGLFDPK